MSDGPVHLTQYDSKSLDACKRSGPPRQHGATYELPCPDRTLANNHSASASTLSSITSDLFSPARIQGHPRSPSADSDGSACIRAAAAAGAPPRIACRNATTKQSLARRLFTRSLRRASSCAELRSTIAGLHLRSFGCTRAPASTYRCVT